MSNTEGEGHASGQPPAAWVWSQYRGESPPESAPEVAPAAAPDPTKSSSMIGLGLAAAVLVVAALTWLFTTNPAPGPTEPAALPKPAAVEEPGAPAKAEAEPPAATTPAAVTQAAPKAEPPAPAPARKKKKKHRRGED